MSFITSSSLSEDDIIRKLEQQTTPPSPPNDLLYCKQEPLRSAAVLVPLIKNPMDLTEPGWHILYTRRTDLVNDHKGQVSFPGGSADPEDVSIVETALREAYEEIGLLPSTVKVLGQMSPLKTITNFLVTPVVGLISWPYALTPQPQEVSRIFTIPLNWMIAPDHYEIRDRHIPPDFQITQLPRHLQVIYFSPYDGETVWGVTAEITLRFLKLLSLA